MGLELAETAHGGSDGAGVGRAQSISTASLRLVASAAAPDADGLAAEGELAAERAEVLGVLRNLELLRALTRVSSVAGTVAAHHAHLHRTLGHFDRGATLEMWVIERNKGRDKSGKHDLYSKRVKRLTLRQFSVFNGRRYLVVRSLGLELAETAHGGSDGAGVGRAQSISTASLRLVASAAAPDADGLAAEGELAAERAEVLGVLRNLELLRALTRVSSVAGTVAAHHAHLHRTLGHVAKKWDAEPVLA